ADVTIRLRVPLPLPPVCRRALIGPKDARRLVVALERESQFLVVALHRTAGEQLPNLDFGQPPIASRSAPAEPEEAEQRQENQPPHSRDLTVHVSPQRSPRD